MDKVTSGENFNTQNLTNTIYMDNDTFKQLSLYIYLSYKHLSPIIGNEEHYHT